MQSMYFVQCPYILPNKSLYLFPLCCQGERFLGSFSSWSCRSYWSYWSYQSLYISCVLDRTNHFISHVYLIIPIILYLMYTWSYRLFYISCILDHTDHLFIYFITRVSDHTDHYYTYHVFLIHIVVNHTNCPDLSDHNADHSSFIVHSILLRTSWSYRSFYRDVA